VSTLTITLDDDKLRSLQEAADRLGLPVEDVVRTSIDNYLARQQSVREAMEYVLHKNAELYRRLAQ
jgi:hypothetical protein